MEPTRRRQTLGPNASAALPAIWKALARKGWSHADLARALKLSSASVANLMYGNHRASRETSTKLQALLGVKPILFDKPCPPNWKPHAYDALRPKARAKAPRESTPFPVLGELGSTGTDD